MAVKLSARMSALAALVTPGVRLADVGTDHGYIPVFLCQIGKIPSAIAMDVNGGPLQRAEAHVAEFGLGDRIKTRLSDGLEKLEPGEADCVLIAGMGGALIQRILSEGEAVLGSVEELILQPQSEVPQTRRFLREHGYRIVDEDMVEEDGKFYFLMKAHRMEDEAEGAEPAGKGEKEASGRREPDGALIPEIRASEPDRQRLEDTFGPALLQKKHPVLLRWVRREMRIVQLIRRQLLGAMYETDTGEIGFILHEQDETPASGTGSDKDTSGWQMDEKQRRIMERFHQAEERYRLLAAAQNLLMESGEK